MPLYDVLIMAKRAVPPSDVAQVLRRVASQVLSGEGVVAGVKSLGRVPLAYGMKKRDGWHREGLLMQMTVMAASTLPKDLEHLNKDERLLRWMVIHNRGNDWMRAKH